MSYLKSSCAGNGPVNFPDTLEHHPKVYLCTQIKRLNSSRWIEIYYEKMDYISTEPSIPSAALEISPPLAKISAPNEYEFNGFHIHPKSQKYPLVCSYNSLYALQLKHFSTKIISRKWENIAQTCSSLLASLGRMMPRSSPTHRGGGSVLWKGESTQGRKCLLNCVFSHSLLPSPS